MAREIRKSSKVSLSQCRKNLALITGATSGLGREFARLAAQDSFTIVATGQNQKALKKLSSELAQNYGTTVYTLALNLCKKGAVKRLVHFVEDLNIPLDLLVNNAGFGLDAPFVQSNKKQQNDLETLDVAVVRKLCRHFLPSMVKRGGGAILNVASVAAFLPGPYMATYFASKAYIASFSLALHHELADKNISVSTLCPGPVKTAFWERANADKTIYVELAKKPDAVAWAAWRGLKRNKALIVPGILAKCIVLGSRLFPRSWMAAGAFRMNRGA